MEKNMDSTDNAVSISAAILFTSLYFMSFVDNSVPIIVQVAVLIVVFTDFIGFCSLYFPFVISTSNKE